MPRTPAPRNVLDAFLTLPRGFEDERAPDPAGRLARLRRSRGIIDNRNGYVHLAGDGAQLDVTVALFRCADGSALFGRSLGIGDPGERHLDGRWVDVTSSPASPTPTTTSSCPATAPPSSCASPTDT